MTEILVIEDKDKHVERFRSNLPENTNITHVRSVEGFKELLPDFLNGEFDFTLLDLFLDRQTNEVTLREKLKNIPALRIKVLLHQLHFRPKYNEVLGGTGLDVIDLIKRTIKKKWHKEYVDKGYKKKYEKAERNLPNSRKAFENQSLIFSNYHIHRPKKEIQEVMQKVGAFSSFALGNRILEKNGTNPELTLKKTDF